MKVTQAEKDFTFATYRKWAGMRERCKQQESKKGRIMRIAIPFTLTVEQFRAWVLVKFKTVDGLAHCEYCNRLVSVSAFSPDHMTPLHRGGASGLDNLAVSCPECNATKGKVGAVWFKFLLKCLWEMPDADANDIRSRLQKAEKLASLTRRNVIRIKQFEAKEATTNDNF